MHARNLMNSALVLCAFVLLGADGFAQSTSTPSTQNAAPAISAKQKKEKADSTVAVAKDTANNRADSLAPADSLAQRLFTIRVTTQPESAQVFLDDSLQGVSPCSVANVIPGAHQLILKKVGCYLKKAQITVDSATPPDYSYTLLQPAFMRVESEPSGAEVAIDGKKTGIAPWESDKIKPGDYTVKMELASYRPVEKKVTAASAGHDTLRIVLVHTEEYQDSVAAARLAETKAKKEHFNGALASALFVLGALVVLVMELLNN
jgi:hypothetical protein